MRQLAEASGVSPAFDAMVLRQKIANLNAEPPAMLSQSASRNSS